MTTINNVKEVSKAQVRETILEDIIRGGQIPAYTDKKEWALINRLSDGNAKLKGSTAERFIIWNLPAIQTCPFATPLCMTNCYARKSERQYPNVLPAREMNFKLSQMESKRFETFLLENLKYMMEKPSYKKAEKVYFRIHESGDFYSQEYMLTLFQVMKKAFKLYGDKLSFTFYTKSIPYLTGIKIPTNCKGYYSVWSDTLPAYMNMARAKRLPLFEAVKPEQVTVSDVQCVGDCQVCKECYDKSIQNRNVKVVIH